MRKDSREREIAAYLRDSARAEAESSPAPPVLPWPPEADPERRPSSAARRLREIVGTLAFAASFLACSAAMLAAAPKGELARSIDAAVKSGRIDDLRRSVAEGAAAYLELVAAK